MNDKTCRPYSDDYLFYDENTNHYVLTEKALIENVGVNLRARMAETALVSPDTAIRSFTRTVSDMIYQFIHEHNVHNERQDCLIATVPELRPIIQKAMEYQAVYVLNVGNLYLSIKPEERAVAIDYLAQSILGNTVPSLGVSILYSGVI
ncbi:MAG: hypothetical protein K2K80_05620 [Clostridia bacterium]|nr:hypothetical protein [Clostridia bacterium]